MNTNQLHPEVERQKLYVESIDLKSIAMVMNRGFFLGLLDIGYQSPAFALAELVDNAKEAGAESVTVSLGYEGKGKKPTMLAIADDGSGIYPRLMPLAPRVGVTHRMENRGVLGRFGWGMTTAALHFGRDYTLFSKVRDGRWLAVSWRTDALAAATSQDAIEAHLAIREEAPPAWALCNGEAAATGQSGTVIVLENLKQIQQRARGFMTQASIRSSLLSGLGYIFRNMLGRGGFSLVVDGVEAAPVDPFFRSPRSLYRPDPSTTEEESAFVWELDGSQGNPSESRASAVFTMEGEGGIEGEVRVSAGYLPIENNLEDPSQYRKGDPQGHPMHPRYKAVVDRENGIMFCRSGRHICTLRPWWTSFGNYDKNMAIQVDFDPVLDELFDVNTSKQVLAPDQVIKDALRDGKGSFEGLKRVVERVRKLSKAHRMSLVSQRPPEQSDGVRGSELIMTEVGRAGVARRKPDTREKRGDQELGRAAERDSRETPGLTPEAARKKRETRRAKYKIEYESAGEAPFYRPKYLGREAGSVISVNKDHPFYSRWYELESPASRQLIEGLLFCLGEAELLTEAGGRVEECYAEQRIEWSRLLGAYLSRLRSDETLESDAEEQQISDEGEAS